ncbi:MAG TPA: hypothetical protein DCM28_21290 [Phycisphaerales bacterium]|nr:hypothetical protein [Phycisphaerales bacterium]
MFNPQTNQTTKWTSRLGIGICVLSLGGMVGMILGVMTLREQPNRLADQAEITLVADKQAPSPWQVLGPLTVSADGSMSSDQSPSAAMTLSDCDIDPARPVQISAQVMPGQSDWVGIAMGQNKMHADFFKRNDLLLYLKPSGRYTFMIQNISSVIGSGTIEPFFQDKPNTMQMTYDPQANTVSASINGVTVIQQHALEQNNFKPAITSVGFRINRGKEAAMATVSQFQVRNVRAHGETASHWNVGNAEQFFIQPNELTVLNFNGDASADGVASQQTYAIHDYAQNLVKTDQATVDHNGQMQISVQLPQGFYSIQLSDSDQSFGIVSQPTFTGKTDPFFCVDSALSWLVVEKNHYTTYPDFQKTRESLVKILKRSGVAMSRERLSWGQIQPAKDQWDWDSPREFETLRRTYQKHGVPVLEMFHSTPAFMGQTSGKRFPLDMHAASNSWQTITKRWQNAWGSVEIWNEPNLDFSGNQPADQYAPLAKTLAYTMAKSGVDVPVGGPGVAGGHDVHYLENLAQNGVLDGMDYYSFHTYHHAPLIEQIVADVRSTLSRYGQSTLPIWITECGRPWRKGTDRPELVEDMESAMDNVMKAIETKACGIARHFVFVYPFYEERSRNFGLMDRQGTPLRAMAAYTQAISALSHQPYIGDWITDDQAVRLARVFGDEQSVTAVFYTGKAFQGQTVTVKLPSTAECFGIDGRRLVLADQEHLAIPDGLTYVRMDRSQVTTQLDRKTRALEMTAAASKPGHDKVAPSPVVMQFMPDESDYVIDVNGYRMLDEKSDSDHVLPLRLMNLGEQKHSAKVTLTCEGQTLGKTQSIDIAAGQTVMTHWPIPVSLVGKPQLKLKFDAQSSTAGVIGPVVINLIGEMSFEQLIAPWPNRQQIVIDDQTLWQMVAAPSSHAKMNFPGRGVWQMDVQLEKNTDNWAYPRLKLNMPIAGSQMQGIILEANARNANAVRLFLWEQSDSGSMESVGYISSRHLVPTDGKWHAVYMPFSSLTLSGANGLDANGKLDLDQVKRLSIGINGKPGHGQIQVRQAWLVGK